MPLLEGAKARTRKGFGENVKREMEAGRPQKQAVAIAYSEADRRKKPKEHHMDKEIKKGHEELHKHHKKEAEHHMKKAEMHKKRMEEKRKY